MHSPKVLDSHLFEAAGQKMLLAVEQGAIYRLNPGLAAALEAAMQWGDVERIALLMKASGIADRSHAAEIWDPKVRVHAFSLAVAQKCNLGCTYCYAQQGNFGGNDELMSIEVARSAVDRLVEAAGPGNQISLAFLGGEPLLNRSVLQEATRYAASKAADAGIGFSFALTTNGTLLTSADVAFFDQFSFQVTMSVDGPREQHNLLRPFKSGQGSFDRILKGAKLLLARPSRRCRVLARVTVTPQNLGLPETLQELASWGFDGVLFSPVLSSPTGLQQIGGSNVNMLLEQMIECGAEFERRLEHGEVYPFANLIQLLQRIHYNRRDPYPCGAGGGYLGVSSKGELFACHRFVEDEAGAMGRLDRGIDHSRRESWISSRHVERQVPCNTCWARYLCGGGCHYEAIHSGRSACDYIRGWLHYCLEIYGQLLETKPAVLAEIVKSQPLHEGTA